MAHDPTRAWQLIPLLSAYNEAVAALPDAPLDVQVWLGRQFSCWLDAFADEDWSSAQPAMRKIRLVRARTRDKE